MRLTVPGKYGALTRRLSIVLEGEKDVEASIPQDVRPDADGDEGIEFAVPQLLQHTVYTQNIVDINSAPLHDPPAYFAQTMQPFPCFDYEPDADLVSSPTGLHCVSGPESSAIPIGIFDDDVQENKPSSDRFCDEFMLALDLKPYQEQDTDMVPASKEITYDNDGWLIGSVIECQ